MDEEALRKRIGALTAEIAIRKDFCERIINYWQAEVRLAFEAGREFSERHLVATPNFWKYENFEDYLIERESSEWKEHE